MPVALSLAFLCVAYTVGAIRLRRHADAHCGPSTARVLAMIAGLCVIELAMSSPLDDLAEQLLAAHMTQHLLLMLIAAPLVVLARPIPYLVWSLPMSLRDGTAVLWHHRGLSTVVHLLKAPAVGWIGFCGTVILWHIPALYRWAMATEIRHALMQWSFLATALMFWSVVLAPARRRALGYAAAGLYVFAAALLTALPGALITFARHPVYVAMSGAAMPWGLTPLADQQLAGLLMWIPMDLTLFAVALALFVVALGQHRSTVSDEKGNTRARFAVNAKRAQHM